MNTIDLARKSVHLIKFLDLEERLKKQLHVKTYVVPINVQSIFLWKFAENLNFCSMKNL